jgi:hypothetical protein
MSEMLPAAQANPASLLPADGRELSVFTVSLCRPMGLKRGVGRKSFIDSVLTTVDEFYADVVQHLAEWKPTAPRMDRPQAVPPEGVSPTADGPPARTEPGDGDPPPGAADDIE